MPAIEAYQVIIGLDGFWHDTKNVLVVPKHQFQGEIIHRDGRRERTGVQEAGVAAATYKFPTKKQAERFQRMPPTA